MRSNLKYTIENLTEAVRKAECLSDVCRLLGSNMSGGMICHFKRRIEDLKLDTSHWLSPGQLSSRRNKSSNKRVVKEVILTISSKNRRSKTSQLRRAMLESGIEEVCDTCKLSPMWNGQKLVLHIDHKDGNYLDNRIHNLRFLCPNCHSQTKTYGSKKLNMPS